MTIKVSNVTVQMSISPSDVTASASNTIAFVQEPFARKIRVANFSIQVLQIESGVFDSTSNTIAFLDDVFAFNAIADRQVPENPIPFVQTVQIYNLGDLRLETVIPFLSTTRQNLLHQELVQRSKLRDYVEYCFGAPWLPIELETVIAFVDAVDGGENSYSVSNTIVFVDDVTDKVNADIQYLNLVQSVSVGFGLDLTDAITFDHAIVSESDFLRSVADANMVEHSLTYYFDNGCSKKQYKQFTGEGSADTYGAQRLTFDANMAVESISTGDLLVLRNPETDDRDRIGFNRINRETRGGELNVFGDPGWAKVNTLLFTIVALADGTKNDCPDVITSLLDFFQDNLGQEIFLHDWTGTSWRGVVTTPNEVATEDAAGWWTMAFEFEGEPDDGSVPNTSMAMTDSMSVNWERVRVQEDVIAFEQTVHAGGDINLALSHILGIIDGIDGQEGTIQEITIMEDGLSGAAIGMEASSPDVGTEVWRTHLFYFQDGTMGGPVDAGAYYPFTPVDGTIYQLTIEDAQVITYSDADNCIWGFFEDVSFSDTVTGDFANGTTDPTTAKAVHLMRETDGGTRNNAYRLGNESDGAWSTAAWTDATLNSNADSTLDLRIILDTRGGAGNWTVQWLAKDVVDSVYTEVGPATSLPSENIGAVGFSNDSGNTELSTGKITLLELREV